VSGPRQSSNEARPRPGLLALLRACKDRPEDDATRLVLADWLEDKGGEADRARAELIRLQLGPASDRRDARVKELEGVYRAAWLGWTGMTSVRGD